MNNLKKHWKEILIVLLVIFSMNKCTVACNRDTKINKQTTEIVQKDSIITAQADSLKYLTIRWNDAQGSMNDYRGIATGNQQEMIRKIQILENRVDSLNRVNDKLLDVVSGYKQQINYLMSKVKDE